MRQQMNPYLRLRFGARDFLHKLDRELERKYDNNPGIGNVEIVTELRKRLGLPSIAPWNGKDRDEEFGFYRDALVATLLESGIPIRKPERDSHNIVEAMEQYAQTIQRERR